MKLLINHLMHKQHSNCGWCSIWSSNLWFCAWFAALKTLGPIWKKVTWRNNLTLGQEGDMYERKWLEEIITQRNLMFILGIWFSIFFWYSFDNSKMINEDLISTVHRLSPIHGGARGWRNKRTSGMRVVINLIIALFSFAWLYSRICTLHLIFMFSW